MLRNREVLFLFLALFVLLTLPTSAQQKKSKEQLEVEKRENIKRIEEAEKILKETEEKKEATMGQLNAINQQIRSREALIRTIQGEIRWYNEKITEDEQIIESLQQDLVNLKEEYAAMVYASYKANQTQNRLTFLFSASSFNQMLIRLQYFEQYDEARRFQAQQITKVEMILEAEIDSYEKTRSEKQLLLADELKERNQLNTLIVKQQNVVANLQVREEELREELESRRRAVAEISTLIARIIEEETKAAEIANASAAITALSSSFEGNKRRLPWPVAEGFISSGFGKQSHPVYKKVLIDNRGVYIQTGSSEDIRAVFNGKVSIVASIPGMNNAVIIQHGDYRTVYANLSEVFVTKGQEIAVNDPIGKVFTNGEGLSELYFEVWRKNTTLNPQQWLSKR